MITLKCPHCGEQFDFEPVTRLSPEELHEKELLQGTLNCVACPKCGEGLNVPVRIIYRETESPYMLVQEPHPLPEAQMRAMAMQLDESATNAAIGQGVQRPIVRLVFTRQDFLEKLYLRRNGLDDRVIEFAKYQLYNGGTEDGQLSQAKHRLLFDFSRVDANTLSFIVYNRSNGRPIRMLEVSRSEYEALVEEIGSNAELGKEIDKCFPGCRVDVDELVNNLTREQ